MEQNGYSTASLKILEKVQSSLKEIEMLSSITEIKQNIRILVKYIEDETFSNKDSLEKILFSKIQATHVSNPELHSQLYILYRNLCENNITVEEAKRLYDMYLEETETL